MTQYKKDGKCKTKKKDMTTWVHKHTMGSEEKVVGVVGEVGGWAVDQCRTWWLSC